MFLELPHILLIIMMTAKLTLISRAMQQRRRSLVAALSGHVMAAQLYTAAKEKDYFAKKPRGIAAILSASRSDHFIFYATADRRLPRHSHTAADVRRGFDAYGQFSIF